MNQMSANVYIADVKEKNFIKDFGSSGGSEAIKLLLEMV